MEQFTLQPIGKIENRSGTFLVRLDRRYGPALKGLEDFSHVVIVWWFDGCDDPDSRGVLEAETPYRCAPGTLGTFATRSPERPNPIALTVARILRVGPEAGTVEIDYTDANDATPVLDIKPYTPSLDRVEHPAVPSWCGHWPKSLEESGEFSWEDEFGGVCE